MPDVQIIHDGETATIYQGGVALAAWSNDPTWPKWGPPDIQGRYRNCLILHERFGREVEAIRQLKNER